MCESVLNCQTLVTSRVDPFSDFFLLFFYSIQLFSIFPSVCLSRNAPTPSICHCLCPPFFFKKKITSKKKLEKSSRNIVVIVYIPTKALPCPIFIFLFFKIFTCIVSQRLLNTGIDDTYFLKLLSTCTEDWRYWCR